jgi:GTPase SAR1 family protein
MAKVLSRQDLDFAGDSAVPPSMEPGSNPARIPRIVLAGEANSGKTTLVNFLLQAELLVTDVVANTPCPTLLRFGDTEHLRLHRADGTVALRSLADLHRIGSESARFIEVFLPNPVLRSIEILDLPGFVSLADAEAKRQWIATADVQIWCTASTQAWRASEQAKWQSLACPPRSALLVLTCRDLLSDRELAEVGERVSRETPRFFSAWTAVATLQAAVAGSPRGAATRGDLWETAGVEDFVKKLKGLLQETITSRRGLLPSPESTASPSRERQSPHPAASFKQVSGRVLAAIEGSLTAQQIAAIMAREFKTFTSLVLRPWLRSNGRPLEPDSVEALMPQSETEILNYLTSAEGRSALSVTRAILQQLEAELAEKLRA